MIPFTEGLPELKTIVEEEKSVGLGARRKRFLTSISQIVQLKAEQAPRNKAKTGLLFMFSLRRDRFS